MNNFLLDFLSVGAIFSGILVITSKNPVISVLFLISVFVNVAGYLVLIGVGFLGISYIIVYVGAIAILFLFVVMMLNLQLSEITTAGSEYMQNLPLGAIIGTLFILIISGLLRSLSVGGNTPGWTKLEHTLTHFGDTSSYFNITTPQIVLGGLESANSIILGDKALVVTDSGQVNSIIPHVFETFSSVSPDAEFINYNQVQSIGMIVYTSGAIWLIIASIILLLAIVGPISLSIGPKPTNDLYIFIMVPLFILKKYTANKVEVI